MIRIEDVTNPDIFDETSAPCKISTKSIILISPIGGEVYNDGDTVLVKWKCTLVERIQILTMRTNFWEPIAININTKETDEYKYTIDIGPA